MERADPNCGDLFGPLVGNPFCHLACRFVQAAEYEVPARVTGDDDLIVGMSRKESDQTAAPSINHGRTETSCGSGIYPCDRFSKSFRGEASNS